jgi:hypothetical protein
VKSPPTGDPRILEALEACRPGSDDLHDAAMEPLVRQMRLFPEFVDLYQRLQRTDHAVAEAFGRVPVPAGLADRVLARLNAADMPTASVEFAPSARLSAADMPTASVGMAPSMAPSVPPRRNRARRAWLVAAGAFAVAAAVLVAVFLNSPKSSRFSVEDVLDETIAFFNGDTRAGGTPLGVEPLPPTSYPLSRALPTRSCQVRWRWVDSLLDCRGVAYDMVGPGGVAATVYVIPLSLSGCGSSPPGVPMLATGRRSAAVWQEEDRLYVLVVEGESREYERFFLE